jgi:hypothetical protein
MHRFHINICSKVYIPSVQLKAAVYISENTPGEGNIRKLKDERKRECTVMFRTVTVEAA